MQKKKVNVKVRSIEDLIQKYLNAKNPQEKAILLGLIKLKDPKFKG